MVLSRKELIERGLITSSSGYVDGIGFLAGSLVNDGNMTGFTYAQGNKDKTMGGWQDATGAQGVGKGLSEMWWGSDMNSLKHGGKDLRSTAMMWVPQMLESTPEAQTLFDEEKYMEMVRSNMNGAINQMMGGYRTNVENIRRGLASRGLSGSSLASSMAGDQSGQMMAQRAGMQMQEDQFMAQARMNRLQQALQYRQGIVGLGLGASQPAHQVQNDTDSDPWGAIAGAAAGGLVGSFTGGLGTGLGAAAAKAIV